ncbi:hypothetical protein [Rummeliibacillus stabekisii]|uniref:hypothetical protein n=1 Tax=Rummeliibacillus stabekisii TaxID=241244 RepID=UPI00116A3F3B|nr:hypothetical protein [Rummeliibacillus stabekisii]MBB5169174.1 hypothetical protein [Rummeliibacillus stabekisii]GEL03435.1 hypothetical protein RST01_00620 [Rummeliibacillus stabekisii]
MIKNQIEYYEEASRCFNPLKHFQMRTQEMENKSNYGVRTASKWNEIVGQYLKDEIYPVVHPIGQETFSLYAVFPTGIFEYALDIDGATALIKKEGINPTIFNPTQIIASVDEGNINKDLNNIKTNHKNPVMILQSQRLMGNMPHCINGNHRIFEAHRNNEKSIEVYHFKDLEFVPFFYDDLSKAMYYLEMDFNNVINDKRDFLKDPYGAFADAF